MFKPIPEVPLRTFCCELKHRPPGDDGSNEELIATLELKIPKLKNSNLEKQWCFATIWERLYSEQFKSQNINQVFIFTANFQELLIRLEVQPFVDETCTTLKAPSEESYNNWAEIVKKRFRDLYGLSIKEWESGTKGRCNCLELTNQLQSTNN